MEGLDADALAGVLQGHLPEKAISLLNEQCVNGSCFMDLDADTLKLFSFPLGFIVEITKLIAAIKGGTKVLDLSSTASVGTKLSSTLTPFESSRGECSASFNVLNSSNKIPSQCHTSERNCGLSNNNRIPKSGDNQENIIYAEGDKESDKDAETDRILSEFVTDEGIQGLSSYSKLNLRGRIERWKCLNIVGSANTAQPNLGIETKYLKTNSKSSQSQSQTSKTSKPPENTRKSVRLESRKQRTEDDMDVEVSGGDDDSDDDDENGSSANKDVVNYDATPLIKTQEELRSISPTLPTLPTFDIEKVLLESKRTKNFVPILRDGKLLGTKERKAVFRLLGRHLCFNYVDDPSKANSSMREGLAKNIVVTYPQFQKSIEVPGKTPWSHIWSKSGGHLNNIIKRIQTGLPDDKRVKKGKVTKKKKPRSVLPCNVNIKELALLMPDRANKLEISDSMMKTFTQRCQLRDNGASITEILKDFPHLKSYNGEMIAAEYQRMCPNSRDMCPEMAKYVPKILEKWNDESLKLNHNDDTFRAFFILASKLPHAIRRSNCVIPEEEEVVVLVTPGIDLDEFVLNRRLELGTAVQPYILALRGQVTKEILKYYLVLDGHILEFGRVPFTRCFDWLFKSYVVFNVNYPNSWTLFFRFLQTCIYKVYFSDNDDIPPAALEKYNEMVAL